MSTVSFPDTPAADCPFCGRIAAGQVLAASDGAAAFFDGFPISPGHALIVPKRHVADWFDLADAEQAEILSLLRRVRKLVRLNHNPDGWNIGVNIGRPGGQTVGHVHVHLIPRYAGDREDPRGGVRWILPEQAKYW